MMLFSIKQSYCYLWCVIIVLVTSTILVLLRTSYYDSLLFSLSRFEIVSPFYNQTKNVSQLLDKEDGDNYTDNGVYCFDKHNRCLFIIGMPSSGSYQLLDILNQHPKINLQGSNNGFFDTIMQLFKDSKKMSRTTVDYESQIARGLKYAIAWYNPEITFHMQQALIQLYNTWFTAGADRDGYIGYIEQSFGLKYDNYRKFKEQVDLLVKFCKNSRIIFHLNFDIAQIAQQKYWKSNQKKPFQVAQRIVYFFVRYHYNHLDNTVISIQQDLDTQNIQQLHNIFQFLELEFDENEFNLTRFQTQKFIL
eukprot:TRINITY_DN3035_c0_g1_i5.p1 TRINITY_DN3035_c0_g1~~TRINITY_DN3035_c0_g1_i5.p1  ORF type:complete len:306 (-),score=13.81 TRINITY_DN3035_c0_g1_i5:376-1293(-)